jgi:hypothetical protein
VVVSRPQTLLFASVFLNSLQISTRSVAIAGTPGDYCVLALEGATADSAYFSGSANVDLTGCGIGANSSNASAISVAGSADLKAEFVEAVGGISVSGNAVLDVAAKIPNSRMIEDPYSDLEPPAPGACVETGYSISGTVTLDPGTYCDGLRLQAHADVTLNPGVYVINAGQVKINGGARIRGTGVTIILTGNPSAGYASIDINGGAVVDLAAPTTGDWAGVVLFQDRNAPSSIVNKFNGGSSTEFTGVIYVPNQEVQFTGGNTADGGCTRIIARYVTFTGNADLDNSCEGKGVRSSGNRPPRLVE